jgi:MFS transporter, DHA1 family, multidrug resistance protein
MTARRRSDRSLILLLATSSAVGTMATNLFLPALPEIRSYFNASLAAAQTMLSVYMIAFAFSILAVGPLSDRFGRRPLMIGGLAVFAVGSLLAVFAPSLSVLVFGRVVQAAGASAVIVLSRAVVGDLYEGADLARRMAMLTMVVVAVTTASPYAGGHIISFGGWRGAFWVQGIIAMVFAVACWRLLPETRRREHMSTSLPLMLQSGRGLLSKPAFSIYVLQSAVILTIFMVFVSVSPYIMADALHRPGTEFGLYFMLIAGGYFLGNMQVSKRSHSVNVERTTNLGLWLQLVAAVLALIFVAAGLKHPMWMFGPMLPLAFGQGLAMPHLTARAVEMAPGNAGVAASLLGFAQQALAAVSVQLMGWARTDTAVPLLLFCTGASLVALIPLLMKGTAIGLRRPPNTSL